MNLRVNFDKSIDFPDEDENSAKADTDFDDMEEEIVIMVTPQPLLQNVESTQIAQALPATTHPAETQRQRNFTETIHFETVQYVDRAVSERYEQSVEVEQLPFLPHKIRLHHHHHKLISTTTSPLATLASKPSPGEAVTEGASSVYDKSTTDFIAGSSEGYGIINVDDEDYADGSVGASFASTFSDGISEATEELSENTYTISTSGTGTEEAQTLASSSIVKVDDNNTMETATSTSAESLTEEMSADVLNTSSTPESIRVEGDEEVNECGFTNGSSDEEEECLLLNSNVTSLSRNDSFNQTLKEEEFFFLAKEILHNDSLHRDRETLRDLLGNISHLENFKDFGSMHRDYGGSFLLPLLKVINYNNNSVPIVFSDLPVNVKVSLNIVHLTNFDSQNMDYTVDLEMNMRWYDVRLANNYTKPIRVRESYILDQIWKPDPYFNSKYSYFHTVSFPNFRMRLMPDGMVHYTLRVTLMPICLMTFCRHPHDSQKCDLIISSVAYTNSVVNFIWDEVEPVRFSTKVSLPELRNKQIVTESCVVEGKLISSSCLRLVFFMERDGARYIVEKYIPSTLAMMFAWVAPYVPYNYEDVRIITPITVLLTLVQMEKGDLEVRTSYLTSMDYWFGAMKTFSVMSLIESLIVLAMIKRGRAMERQAQRAANEYRREFYRSEKRRITELYHRLDAASRFLSPVIFVIFFIYYVLYIAQGDEKSCLPKSIY